MYKLYFPLSTGPATAVSRANADGSETSVPYVTDNTDYQRFKADLANGVALSDAEGNPMTADQIKTFLEGLA